MNTIRKLSIALMVSAALNFLFIGMMLTVFFGPAGGPVVGGVAPMAAIARGGRERNAAAIERLSEENRPIVADIWRTHMRGNRGGFRQIFELRRDVQALLTADEIDEDAIIQAIEALRDKEAAQAGTQAATMIAIAQVLPREEREKYFARGIRRDGGRRQGRRRPIQ